MSAERKLPKLIVISEESEHGPEMATFYHDIFTIKLSDGVSIGLVPATDSPIDEAAIITSSLSTVFDTADEVRQFALWTRATDYAITASIQKAGQIETIRLPEPTLSSDLTDISPELIEIFSSFSWPTQKNIFYVSPEQFATFVAEARNLVEIIPWPYYGFSVRLNQFEKFALVQYIIQTII